MSQRPAMVCAIITFDTWREPLLWKITISNKHRIMTKFVTGIKPASHEYISTGTIIFHEINPLTNRDKSIGPHILFYESSTVLLDTQFTGGHDDVIKWKHFPRYWPFVQSPVNSSRKGQWRGALVFSLICAWTNSWANNRDAGNLRRYRAHYGVIVMGWGYFTQTSTIPLFSRIWCSYHQKH